MHAKNFSPKMDIIFILQAAIEFWKAELSQSYVAPMIEGFQKLDPLPIIKIYKESMILVGDHPYWELFQFQLKIWELTDPEKAEKVAKNFFNPIKAFLTALNLKNSVENEISKFKTIEAVEQNTTDMHVKKLLPSYPYAKDYFDHSDDLDYLKQPELIEKVLGHGLEGLEEQVERIIKPRANSWKNYD